MTYSCSPDWNLRLIHSPIVWNHVPSNSYYGFYEIATAVTTSQKKTGVFRENGVFGDWQESVKEFN